jgi:hypothetical protein
MAVVWFFFLLIFLIQTCFMAYKFSKFTVRGPHQPTSEPEIARIKCKEQISVLHFRDLEEEDYGGEENDGEEAQNLH